MIGWEFWLKERKFLLGERQNEVAEWNNIYCLIANTIGNFKLNIL